MTGVDIEKFYNKLFGAVEDRSTKLDLSGINLDADISVNIDLIEQIKNSIPDLTELNLSNTQLTELPKEIRKFEHLSVLNLSNNKLEKLPTALSKLRSLETLDIRSNNIKDINPLVIFPIRKNLNSFLVADNLLNPDLVETIRTEVFPNRNVLDSGEQRAQEQNLGAMAAPLNARNQPTQRAAPTTGSGIGKPQNPRM